ncbi:MAG: trypsin-like peptidase domain-containing protein [Blautia sp.]|nr:trypsin-like peptidase domain-containing protein [Blautia sp.]MCM1199639.1 trypsin-like peptidase domain-containing protein [Bacteroides fragilis]
MYENNYPNENQDNGLNTEQSTDLKVAGGIFSSRNEGARTSETQSAQTSQDTYGNGSRANSYYGSAHGDYGYGAAGVYRNPNGGQDTGSYQYGNTYPNDYGQTGKEKKKKEKSAGGGYLKKALVSVSLGLFFGVCAGIGLYAVEASTGMLDKDKAEVKTEMEAETVIDRKIGEETAAEEAEAVTSDAVADSSQGTDIKMTLDTAPQISAVQDVSGVVSAVMPSVVSISNTYTETLSYFGQSMTNEAEASGSGIIVGENDSELLIVTNYHVIAEADKLTVQFVEGSEAEASVKGTDADMDLAVIAVPLENILTSTLNQIAVAALGDSDSLKVGEPAIAIGNSLGYGQSVTTGVISALDRDMELSDGSTGTFIQTDAAINPGNSGGALLNMKGEVIGINSNKIGGSVIEGMGYAIPISAASPIIADLMLRETKNKVAEEERGFLGISGISVTEEVSNTYGMPEGVYIAQVYENTAAAEAGLVKGDIITAFDGIKISSMDELQRQLEYYAKGDTVEITVMTIGNGGYHSKTVDITLGNKVTQ